MAVNRRRFVGGTGAALGVATLARRAHAAEFTFKLGHSTPADAPFSKRIVEASEEILKETKGRLRIEIFPNSELGGDNQLLAEVRSGAVQMFPAAGLILASVLPVTAINGMGFAFASYAQVWPAMDGKLGAYVRQQILTKTNLVPMDKMWDLGYRQVTNSARPIRTAADLKGLKLRVPGAPPLVSMFQALKAAPVSMQFGEVYTALQTHVVDGQENPLEQIEVGKFYEVQKYLSLTNHVWDGFWMLCNGPAWKRLPKDVQEITNRVFNEKAIAERADLVELNKGLLAQLKSQGMAVNTADTATFRKQLVAAGFYTEWRKRIGNEAWTILESYAGKLG